MSKTHAVALAAALAILPSVAANAADTHPAWQGLMQITASTPSCAAIGGTSPGDNHVVIYRPQFTSGDAATISSMSILQLRSAMLIQKAGAGQMNGSSSYTATIFNARAKMNTGSGTYTFTTSPATVTPTTPVVQITGTINDFKTVIGCNVTFKVAMILE